MKIIIAGGRNANDYLMVKKAIEESKFNIQEIISGGAKGADSLGEKYAKENNIKLTIFKAEWKNINVSEVLVKHNSYGPYNALAGHIRNRKMGDYGDGLIAIWDGRSKGTKNMIDYVKKLNKKIYIYRI